MKKIAALILIAVLPAAGALAASKPRPNNIGCGFGSMLFEGKSGVPEQVLGATTNGTLGSQTFGISSGTAGCSRDGVVTLPAKVAMFVDTNMERLAYDMAVGRGESLQSLAKLIGVEENDRAAFYDLTKEHFAEIIPSQNMNSAEVVGTLNRLMAQDSELAQYARLL